ncbi:response regulator [Parachryseolinea silvisoli]|jgi:signal transduction histidine kinase|uniref:response regulator n=1 Tax=Parachryseolinea silvisoli TaxID=2873601 RepID=UPI0022658C17|nr:response regulator [Parachryseolinea silvisoli]MCD9018194.1 response regulator [Parachryseolinea silvisoli]
MRPKILLVDDREDNLLSIETILEPSGYQFVKAQSGRQALKILLTEYDFAMILMDVKMPNLNGFETASLIYERDKLKHIPIIFITANNFGDENMFRGYQAGAVDYIFKPINADVLRAKVSVLVDLYRKNHQLKIQEQKLISINQSLQLEIKERIASEERVRQLNSQLLENIERLEAVNKELDRFAFMASHDLQEPLRKIRLFCNKLFIRYKDMLDDSGIDDFNRIQRSAERMQTLIRDILTFSRISDDAGEFISTDLSVLLNEVLSEMDDEFDIKEADIVIENLPVYRVNAGLIKLLFHNLITNALKYRKKELRPTIQITTIFPNTEVLPVNGKEYLRISIKDNGLGFDQKYAEEIFGMFKRLHHNSEFKGTGIGLALCKKIVEHHKGFISALSTAGEGSTFTISLPIQQGELVDQTRAGSNHV